MPTLDCPICRRKLSYDSIDQVPYRPFCGKRCKLIDLSRWLDEEYRISEELPLPKMDEQFEQGSDSGPADRE